MHKVYVRFSYDDAYGGTVYADDEITVKKITDSAVENALRKKYLGKNFSFNLDRVQQLS